MQATAARVTGGHHSSSYLVWTIRTAVAARAAVQLSAHLCLFAETKSASRERALWLAGPGCYRESTELAASDVCHFKQWQGDGATVALAFNYTKNVAAPSVLCSALQLSLGVKHQSSSWQPTPSIPHKTPMQYFHATTQVAGLNAIWSRTQKVLLAHMFLAHPWQSELTRTDPYLSGVGGSRFRPLVPPVVM